MTNIPRSVCHSEPLNHGWVSSYRRGSGSAVSHHGGVGFDGPRNAGGQERGTLRSLLALKTGNRCDAWQSSTHTNETLGPPSLTLKEGEADSDGRTEPCVCLCPISASGRGWRAGGGAGAVLIGGRRFWLAPDSCPDGF